MQTTVIPDLQKITKSGYILKFTTHWYHMHVRVTLKSRERRECFLTVLTGENADCSLIRFMRRPLLPLRAARLEDGHWFECRHDHWRCRLDTLHFDQFFLHVVLKNVMVELSAEGEAVLKRIFCKIFPDFQEQTSHMAHCSGRTCSA